MGKNHSGKYGEVISLVIHKLGNRLPKQDKADLWQEAELALFLANSDLENHEAPERLAYKIVKSRIIDFLRKTPPKSEDISDPSVIRKYDKQSVQYPNIETKLDAEKAVHLVNRLPNPYRFVLIMTFGLEDNPQFTEQELAALMKKTRQWVSNTKKLALVKLKILMER